MTDNQTEAEKVVDEILRCVAQREDGSLVAYSFRKDLIDIIQRLLDERDAEIQSQDENIGQLLQTIHKLRQKLAETKEYLVELRGVWSWRKKEPRNRNSKEYAELDSFIKQLN